MFWKVGRRLSGWTDCASYEPFDWESSAAAKA